MRCTDGIIRHTDQQPGTGAGHGFVPFFNDSASPA
jgi:hypothetical protein